MNYGYFAKDKREYVITRPDTPAPWVNYLGSPEYGAIISQNAGGYSFVKSGARGRILRYRFNYDDMPGRYIYLRDDDNGDYWSASWQPVGKREGFRSQCRHGLGYTVIESQCSEIVSSCTYYVPRGKSYEIWHQRLQNKADRERHLSIFGYAEFSNHGDYEQDLVNLQYSQFISRTYFDENKIIQAISEDSDQAIYRFFALTGAPVSSYCGDREAFIGDYRSYRNPLAVAAGHCTNVLNYNRNSCGALHTELSLQPGEERELTFILGQHDQLAAEEIVRLYEQGRNCRREDEGGGNGHSGCAENGQAYGLPGRCKFDLKELDNSWQYNLANLQVATPDEDFNQMVNSWLSYQCFTNFTWSRAASLIYCGPKTKPKFGDTVQDIQGIIHLRPDLAREKLIFMLSAQLYEGAGLPLVSFDHYPGRNYAEDAFSHLTEKGQSACRADDTLWLFPTVRKYLAETGELDFLRLQLPYVNTATGTVYEHLKQAIAFSFAHLGRNGLPAGLQADWNDTLHLGVKGESTFVALQLYLALTIMQSFAGALGDNAYLKYLKEQQRDLGARIDELCFEGDRYIRGISEDGLRIGSKFSSAAKLWLNPQSWAVVSGLTDPERARVILDKVYEMLNGDYGVSLMDSSLKDLEFAGAQGRIYNDSSKENAGIFLQAQGWLILAETLLGRGGRAYSYFMASSPAHQNDIAEIRVMEPYVYGQFAEGCCSPHEGRSHVPWLTGTAASVMVACVEGILGLRPDLAGIRIEPVIPGGWGHLSIDKVFRGKKLHICIENKDGRESGYREIYLNGQSWESNYFAFEQLDAENEIIYIM